MHFCLHICEFRVFFLERWKLMHLLGLVRQCTQYCGIQISSVGCFVHPHQTRRISCEFLDPDACNCHFLTPCQVHCDHITAILCDIISIKWKLRPRRLIAKCPDHICCLNNQCSKIFSSAAKCIHGSVFIQVLRNSNRKDSNFSFSQVILPVSWITNLCNFCEMLLQQIGLSSSFLLLGSLCSSAACFKFYLVTHLGTYTSK